MQYILTEEEYCNLGPLSEIKELKNKLDRACIYLASLNEYTNCPIINSLSTTYCYNCDAYKEQLCDYSRKRLPK